MREICLHGPEYVKEVIGNIPTHIEDYGCSIISVLSEGGSPPFAYTVSLHEQGFPELIIVGLSSNIAGQILMSAAALDGGKWEGSETGGHPRWCS